MSPRSEALQRRLDGGEHHGSVDAIATPQHLGNGVIDQVKEVRLAPQVFVRGRPAIARLPTLLGRYGLMEHPHLLS